MNVHERSIQKPLAEAIQLLDSLSSANDLVWPHEKWPAMKFDKPLQVGAHGGHGPIRYFVKSYEPGKNVYFEFSGPSGFNGHHGFEIGQRNSHNTIIRHVLKMKVTGSALLTWPLVFRPLHDALIEDSFDKAERNLGFTPKGVSWSVWVRLLRWVFRKTGAHNKSLERTP